MSNKGCTQINMLLLTLCYHSASILIVDRPKLIDYLVAFGRIFRSLFEYTGGLIQPLDRQNLQ